MSILYVQFPDDFSERYEEYRDMLLDIIKEKEPEITTEKAINENEKPIIQPVAKDLKSDILIGKLGAFNDGTIRYGGEILDMRNQIKDLCRYFMERPNRLITYDDIKQNIINADKRLDTPNSTIAKYVSELRKLLKIHFRKDVLPSQNEEGWYFKT